MKGILLTIFLCASALSFAQDLVIKNDKIQRILSYDGEVWRTTKFADRTGKTTMTVKSDEFHILPMDSKAGFSIADFTVVDKPNSYQSGDTSFVKIGYGPKPDVKDKPEIPVKVNISYYAVKGQNHLRKTITLEFSGKATVDRLEVERFIVHTAARGGGRGEPVFIGDQWFTGLEYPAGYTRHTNGNLPADYSRHYEKVGNYSFIDLEGRDIDPAYTPGMIRLMHFPGFAISDGSHPFIVKSKTSVFGFAGKGASVENAFMRYVASVWKAPRSFLHYNNWFEPKAKDLKGDALVQIWKEFKAATSPYGVKLDAMVVDDGWQDRKSIWEPSDKHFPNGWSDVKKLVGKLKAEGVDFGFWLSLNGYTNNVDWGVANGYKEALRNDYFKQYGRYYSLSSEKYKKEVLQKIPFIARETGAVYFKHDFNEFSDKSEGNGHPSTDRHGHEANLDSGIEVLLATRKANPEIIQNLTNWIWFSPWWLMYADYLWMLAGDDGTNGNWPEISTRTMASTDRDTYLWRMWGNSADRPLVPISRLMTHGIIKNSRGMMESKEDNLQDWLEYVLMHYGRGTLLKEWYISPSALNADDWKALCTVDNWAKENRQMLNNTVLVGGRPDEGNAYGYIGWHNDKGVLVARNTRAEKQKLIFPFNAGTGFYQRAGESYMATVVFPYQDIYPVIFKSGGMIEIELPGYATMAFSFQKGKPKVSTKLPGPVQFDNIKGHSGELQSVITIPADVKDRCDLLLIGYPKVPVVKIDGVTVSFRRSSKASLNNFASYAISGMVSEKAREWTMQAIDLLPYKGRKITITYDRTEEFESHILAERQVKPAAVRLSGKHLLWPISNDTRRETIRLYGGK